MANFAHLLRKPADEVSKPQALPDGTYFGTINNYEFGESKQKKTPYIQFNITLTHAAEGVDTEGLEPAGRKTRDTYYITDDSLWRLKDFLTSLGINMEGRTFEETLPQAQGASVMVDMTKVPNQNGDDFYNQAAKVVGVAGQEAADAPAEAPVARRRGAAA